MTQAQAMLMDFISQQDPAIHPTISDDQPDSIEITKDGRQIKLSANLYGDIICNRKIIATSNTAHTITGSMINPTEWTLTERKERR